MLAQAVRTLIVTLAVASVVAEGIFIDSGLWRPAIALAAVLVAFIVASIRIIPAVQFGVVKRFGKRTGRVLGEGLKFVVPFFDVVDLFSEKLDSDEVEVGFTTKDKVRIDVRGSTQWRADKSVGYLKEGTKVVRFIEMSADAIEQGLRDAVESLLGAIAGLHDVNDFINKRTPLEQLINASLRLEEPPHLFPEKIAERLSVPGALPVAIGDLKDADGKPFLTPAQNEVPPDRYLAFYAQYGKEIRALLKEEQDEQSQVSPVEERYGISIVTFALAQVTFDEKTQEAFELARQADARTEAAGKLSLNVIELAATLRKKNKKLTQQEAINQAAATLGIATKNVISIEGGGGNGTVIPVITPGGK